MDVRSEYVKPWDAVVCHIKHVSYLSFSFREKPIHRGISLSKACRFKELRSGSKAGCGGTEGHLQEVPLCRSHIIVHGGPSYKIFIVDYYWISR